MLSKKDIENVQGGEYRTTAFSHGIFHKGSGCEVRFRGLHDALFEVSTEHAGLVLLDLAVLHRCGAQELVQLDGVHGCGALLIRRRHGADPVMNVIRCGFARFACLQAEGRKTDVFMMSNSCCTVTLTVFPQQVLEVSEVELTESNR